MALCLPCFLVANPGRKSRLVTPMPDPGTLTQLGMLQELRIARDKDGEEEVHRFGGPAEEDGPPLFWSTKLRMLLCIPPKRPKRWKNVDRMSREEADELFRSHGAKDAAKLFREWSIHEPSGLSKVKLRDYKLQPKGSMRHVIYRSDKFSRRKTLEDYVHHMPKTDRIAIAGRPGRIPDAIAIWGPALTVTESGIVN